ncbi:MAG: hypothetical protein FWC34_06145 [Bacteroidetes bacterium]|nr:hypothetical protein [Bacteroidota bacterium]MCL2302975.1 hypothetical protein [Lentimicrobiaceae bacterium]
MKQTLFLIIFGITTLFISCKKYEDCRIFDPFTEVNLVPPETENICITKAIFKHKYYGRIEGWIVEPNKYSGYKTAYYTCSGIQLDEENCEVIKLKETYCK